MGYGHGLEIGTMATLDDGIMTRTEWQDYRVEKLLTRYSRVREINVQGPTSDGAYKWIAWN
jgi:hypothetical protein